jgi:acetylornithine deacetylase
MEAAVSLRERALIKARAERGRSVDMLASLVRIPSPTGEEGEAQGFLAHHLRRLGAEVRMAEPDVAGMFARYPEVAQYPTHWKHDLVLPYEDLPTLESLQQTGLDLVLNYRGRPNLTARWPGQGGGRSLILNGHIDTVAPGPGRLWQSHPLAAELRGGRMYGRGTSDMKGGLAAALMALTFLVEEGFEPAGDLSFQSVVNEEHSGNGTLDLVRRGLCADAAIVLEPTDNRIAVAQPGGVYWQIDVFGTPLAPGARWRDGRLIGVSAIELLPLFISALLALERAANEGARAEPMPLSIVIGKVEGGNYETVAAADASLRGVAYFAPEVGTPRTIMARLRAAVEQVNRSHPHLQARPGRIAFLHHDDGVTDGGAAEAAGLLGGILRSRGLADAPVRAPYCCDLRHLVNQGGLRGLVFGPGSVVEAHRPNESIGLREFHDAIEALIEFVSRWCSAQPAQAISLT